MAKAPKEKEKIAVKKHQATSIGSSNNSRPKNKDKRQSWKKYRGQGR
jgi:hypothetical protein